MSPQRYGIYDFFGREITKYTVIYCVNTVLANPTHVKCGQNHTYRTLAYSSRTQIFMFSKILHLLRPPKYIYLPFPHQPRKAFSPVQH